MTTDQPYAPPPPPTRTQVQSDSQTVFRDSAFAHPGQPYSADDTPAPGSRDRDWERAEPQFGEAHDWAVQPGVSSIADPGNTVARPGPIAISVAQPNGSPRWLQIVRDVFHTLACAVVVAAAVLVVWAVVASDSSPLEEFGNEPVPAATYETCTDPNVPWCEPIND